MYAIRNSVTGHEKTLETKAEVQEYVDGLADPENYTGWQAIGIIANVAAAQPVQEVAQESAPEPVEPAPVEPATPEVAPIAPETPESAA